MINIVQNYTSLYLSGIIPSTAACGQQDIITVTIYNMNGQSVCSFQYTVNTPTSKIIGLVSFCAGSSRNITYTVSSNASVALTGTFTWSSSNTAWTVTNNGSAVTTLTAPSTAGATTLTVKGGNLCQPVSIVVTALPNTLAMPNSPAFLQSGNQCAFDGSILPVSGATSYQWSENNFASILETTTGTRTTDGPFFPRQTYNVSVRATNMCTNGPIRTITHTMPAPPVGCLARMMNIESAGSVDQTDVLIYPNPSYDLLHINLPDGDETTQLKLFNTAGQLVKNLLTHEKEISLEIQGVPSGLYILTISSPSINTIKKVQVIK